MILFHRHELVALPGSPMSAVKGVSITTTTNAAYEMVKQEGGTHEYDLVSEPPGTYPPPAKDLGVAYETPSLPPSHQPLPAIPLPVATPPSEKVGVAGEEEEEGVYDSIPGDQ